MKVLDLDGFDGTSSELAIPLQTNNPTYGRTFFDD